MMELCIHFLGDKQCELDRPVSCAYCNNQCAAYEPEIGKLDSQWDAMIKRSDSATSARNRGTK